MWRNRYLFAIFFFIGACTGEGLEDGTTNELPIDVVFENQSQFTVEGIYIHSEPTNYNDVDNQILEFLLPANTVDLSVRTRDWYVTVFRKPNETSEVLAYTMAWTWNPIDYRRIIYFDEIFRVSID
ncbi:MAG: hypothetical protein HRU19_06740 [Pseudobacteriovorax sp.]|nr:hypothetical protein [Pseudobacteriovorax sp.]